MVQSRIGIFLVTVAALVGLGILAYSVLLLSGPSEDEADRAGRIATDFIRNAPTYRWNGMEGSLEHLHAKKVGEKTFGVRISFTSAHGGYGDRTGKVVTQVITHHEAIVLVEEGKVIEAVLDGRWDELHQKPLGS